MDSTNPSHYKDVVPGIECIELTESMDFVMGNVVKYLWRWEHKNGKEDLEKALWYVNRAIAKPHNFGDRGFDQDIKYILSHFDLMTSRALDAIFRWVERPWHGNEKFLHDAKECIETLIKEIK